MQQPSVSLFLKTRTHQTGEWERKLSAWENDRPNDHVDLHGWNAAIQGLQRRRKPGRIQFGS